MTELLYFLMLAFFITHELDAVLRCEWRVLPLTSFMPEPVAKQVFIWAHIPLFLIIFATGGMNPHSLTATLVSAFSIVHILLHWLYRNHSEYQFNNPGSWALIIGAGAAGLLHLLASGILI